MTQWEFIDKLKNIADNLKTLYVMGCFGAPMTEANKKRYTQNNPYNTQASRVKMINAADSETYGFDCICLVKGVLWGFSGDNSKVYGGATYASNGVPDIGADAVINVCKGVSTNFTNIEAGELVWMSGHVGIYIGGGKVIECTPKWSNNVQYSNLGNLSQYKTGNYRIWTKHGKLPYIDYTEKKTEEIKPVEPKKPLEPSDYAKEACEKAKNKGIILGNSSGDFMWQEPLTRQDFFVILNRMGLLE